MRAALPTVALCAVLTACNTAQRQAMPADFACAAKDSAAVEFAKLPASLGQCVRTRGLAAGNVLYENGYAFAHRPHGKPPALAIGLLWQAGAPASLQSHPQFIEISGRVVACREASCGGPFALTVSVFKIVPTAMD